MLASLHDKAVTGEPFYSFEFFPPFSERGRQALLARVDRMADMQPQFVSVTCSSKNRDLSLSLCKNLLKFCGVNVVIHISCSGFTVDSLCEYLEKIKDEGISNVLAIRGEDFDPLKDEIPNALELIKIMRREFGEYFTIGVAGYPEGKSVEIARLREKVDAGADFCLTQAIFDPNIFSIFRAQCRKAGIPEGFPIIPGIIVIQSYSHVTSICNQIGVSIPKHILSDLETIKSSPSEMADYGIALATGFCNQLRYSVPGLHFFTFNLESSVREILQNKLKMTPQNKLPWRPSLEPKRIEEEVRPIFWANRPKSYLSRTDSWDKFPASRWADANLSFSSAETPGWEQPVDVRLKHWGESPQNESEVFQVFAEFVEGSIPCLPWCEESLHLETKVIRSKLAAINRAGFLTINSQPRVNAAPSNDPNFGWGPDRGYMYQKAYIEFFTSAKRLRNLIDLCKGGSYDDLVYHAVDAKGNTYSNNTVGKPCAVTWAVFPGKEIIQPTVVDPESFLVWKDEAFSLWIRTWADIYHEESLSYDLINDIHDQYFLVNIVDNDFINGDIFQIFDDLVKMN